jgi:hypothetical protein
MPSSVPYARERRRSPERRALVDRRSGVDRRGRSDRRQNTVAVSSERRGGVERRAGLDRRDDPRRVPESAGTARSRTRPPDDGFSAAMPYLLQLIATGRTSSCTIPWCGWAATLRHHPVHRRRCPGGLDAACRARHTGDAWRLVDPGSRNGTYLNGGRVQERRRSLRATKSGWAKPAHACSSSPSARHLERPYRGSRVRRRGRPCGRRPLAVTRSEARPYGVTLIATATGKRFEAQGTRIASGAARSAKCARWRAARASCRASMPS